MTVKLLQKQATMLAHRRTLHMHTSVKPTPKVNQTIDLTIKMFEEAR